MAIGRVAQQEVKPPYTLAIAPNADSNWRLVKKKKQDSRPIVYFCFVQNQRVGYLSNLNREIQEIKGCFITYTINGCLTFIVDENAHIKQLANSLQMLSGDKERPKIIHFSGDYQDLELNSANLRTSFKELNNVKLIFLNGIHTKELKNFLLDEIGVEAVIGTSPALSDDQLTRFSVHFYESWLREGVTLEQAFKESMAYSNIAYSSFRGATRGAISSKQLEKDKSEKGYFDFGLYFKDEKAQRYILNTNFDATITANTR